MIRLKAFQELLLKFAGFFPCIIVPPRLIVQMALTLDLRVLQVIRPAAQLAEQLSALDLKFEI